jgi:glycosyltransferase involved in cell wall biosynthesis
MRIGLVTGEYPPMQGGVGAYSRILAGTFAEQGHDVFVFSSSAARDENPAVRLTNTITRWAPGSLRAVRRWAHAHRLDVVSLQFETAAFGMSPWIHFLPDVLRGLPVVTTFHDLLYPYLFPKAGPLRDWIVLRLARKSAGVIATNHEDMARLANLPRARLIPIGSNITPPSDNLDRQAWRAKATAQDGDYLIGYFGFASRSKGLETLLHALAALRTDGLPVKLVMIGGRTGTSDSSNTAYAAEIDALISRLALEPVICRTGYITDDEVSAYLRACDLVALPFRDGASYRRGSLMAALQHGCAIITTQPKVEIPTFRHGQNMLLIPPEDSPALVDAIREMLQSPDKRETLQLGAEEIAKHFEWDPIAEGYIDLFSSVLAAADYTG